MPCISLGNDPPQSVDFKRSKDVADFLVRLDGAGELLEANVRPELILDSLLLAWPSRIGGTDRG